MHILILGGTSEASALLRQLALHHPAPRVTLSLAGRTRAPVLPPHTDYRIGGFGGVEGLTCWLREHRVNALICATHPFARQMPFHAAQAAKIAGVPLLFLLRDPWRAEAGDDWTEVADHTEAIATLGSAPRRIFLTVGRLEMPAYQADPQHFYLARSIDPVPASLLPHAQWITARPPFTLESERALITQYQLDSVITKNSGGEDTRAKLLAARELGLPVVLIRRPPRPEGLHVASAPEALSWVAQLHDVSPS